MGYLIGLMTVILAIDCVFLILLILMQLPKKEAGMGTAFGGAATDALFGAGSGNVLTTLTRYAATLFFVVAVSLTVLNAHRSYQEKSVLKDVLKKQAGMPGTMTNQMIVSTNLAESPAKAMTNAANAIKPATTNLLLTTSNAVATPKK
jgi:preprotein translocase subunit SecG